MKSKLFSVCLSCFFFPPDCSYMDKFPNTNNVEEIWKERIFVHILICLAKYRIRIREHP
uniref:Uncharacterized protein n=1 Tax=Anguilla anguilla TaxID=7936 RepID=A0A0E9SAI4_ANGAN